MSTTLGTGFRLLTAPNGRALHYSGAVTLPPPLVIPPAPTIQYENTSLFILNIKVAAGYTFADVAYTIKGTGPYYATSLSIQLPANATLNPGDIHVYIYAAEGRTESEHLVNLAAYMYKAPEKTTPAEPVYTGDDTANTLTLTHPLGLAELLESTDGGATFAAATTLYRELGDVAVAAGQYRAKTRATSTRNESSVAQSPAFTKKVVAAVGRIPNGQFSQAGVWNTDYSQLSIPGDGKLYVNTWNDPFCYQDLGAQPAGTVCVLVVDSITRGSIRVVGYGIDTDAGNPQASITAPGTYRFPLQLLGNDRIHLQFHATVATLDQLDFFAPA